MRNAAARFTTPLLPDDYLTLLNPLWSARELRGKVVMVTRTYPIRVGGTSGPMMKEIDAATIATAAVSSTCISSNSSK